MLKLATLVLSITVILWVSGLIFGFYFDKKLKYEDRQRENRKADRRSAWIEEYDLPPCKGVECYRCANIGYIKTDYGICVIGCAKGRHPCADFLEREIEPETLSAVKSALEMHNIMCDNGLNKGRGET